MTVAVNCTGPPIVDGFADDVTTVVVAALPIVTVKVPSDDP